MPELPEVETVRRGLDPLLTGARLQGATVRDGRLRWGVPADLGARVAGRRIAALKRRAKYLLLPLDDGSHLLLHLGMSGQLAVVDAALPPRKHDHLDLLLDGDRALRFHDPRRFGAVLHSAEALASHPLLAGLGPEPLAPEFDAHYLQTRAAARSTAIKTLIMDASVVVGVGNIYAAESLFRAGIHPAAAASSLSRARCGKLVTAIRQVLSEAIDAGGTTLRDFRQADGRLGYFQQSLDVYGREGEPCSRCTQPIIRFMLNQRSSYCCSRCQRR